MERLRCGLRTMLLMTLIMGLSWFPVAWADLNDGLVAYYPFDGDAQDESGNGNHGVIIGDVVYVQGKNDREQAVYFNNPYGSVTANQYMSLPYSQSIQSMESSSFTISILYKTTDHFQHNGRLFGNKSYLVMDYNAGIKAQAYSHVSDGLNNYLVAYNADNNPSAITTDGQFHLQSLVLDRENNSLTQYIDGRLIDVIDVSAMGFINLNGLVLGATKVPDTYGARLMAVDELRIYNRTLSESEIKLLYTMNSDSGDNGENKYTQADLDAAREEGQQACIANPASCGITIASLGGFTQSQLDSAKQAAKEEGKDYCKSNPGLCGITNDPPVNCVTQSELDSAKQIAKQEGKQEGKDYCESNPGSCGITIASLGGFTQSELDSAKQAAKQEGKDYCKSNPSLCGITNDPPVNCVTQSKLDSAKQIAKQEGKQEGKDYCKSNPDSCGIPIVEPIGLSSDLRFHIPHLNYDSPAGLLQLWADFEFAPIQDRLLFEVIDFGEIAISDKDNDGYTVEEGDCDDNNPNIHPDAEEIVGDDINQDCIADVFD